MVKKVYEDEPEHRVELDLPDSSTALIYYRVDDKGRLVLFHTDVPTAFAGLGIGSQLAAGAFDRIRYSGRKVILRCAFLQTYVRDHPEYRSEEHTSELQSPMRTSNAVFCLKNKINNKISTLHNNIRY